MNRNKYLMLARREFWEHRSLWIFPVIVAGVLLLCLIGVALFVGGNIHIQGSWGRGNIQLPPGASNMTVGLFQTATQILGVTALVCVIFLLDCLHAERRDRSILFWKSLPVSDAATVLTKYAIGLCVVPLLGFALVSVVFPLSYGVASLALPELVRGAGGWSSLAWLRAEGALLFSVLASMLWYAPLAAWAMLASVAARRWPILLAILPLVGFAIAENLLLQTTNVWVYIGRRLVPLADAAAGVQRLDLWLGLVVAAALVHLAIRLRRYRDDS